MGITLSDSAADRVKRFLTNRGKGVAYALALNFRLFRYGLRSRIR